MKNTVKIVCEWLKLENNELRHWSAQDKLLLVPRIYQVICKSSAVWEGKADWYLDVKNLKCKIIISTEIIL